MLCRLEKEDMSKALTLSTTTTLTTTNIATLILPKVQSVKVSGSCAEVEVLDEDKCKLGYERTLRSNQEQKQRLEQQQ